MGYRGTYGTIRQQEVPVAWQMRRLAAILIWLPTTREVSFLIVPVLFANQELVLQRLAPEGGGHGNTNIILSVRFFLSYAAALPQDL